MFIYGKHTGGYYESDTELTDEQLYCDTCNDYDNFICEAESLEEAIAKGIIKVKSKE